ncbi:hypothetical protein SAMN05443252_101873 [Bacillus sp. OV322]|uniref:hypothetical protein n=1 Tax=Bacillus sp. OV322 TaxID=1882764 RepID=UPI0008EB69B3|nr:hypothetical protein [Bacillus sp. OV322]SFC09847.1 hypothetical protein SAMN05443252_101873 [Bacillus sp. OV322]
MSGVLITGAGFINKPLSFLSAIVGTGYAWKETYKSYLSFKTYMKKSDKRGYQFKVKTVYYKDTKFRGKTLTKYNYEN